MSPSLLFLVPRIGAASELFVAAHVNQLAPEVRCSVIAREVLAKPFWSAQPPVLDLGGRGLAPYQSRRYRVAKRWLPPRITAAPPRADPATVSAITRAIENEPDTAILAEYLDAWAAALLEAPLGDRPVVVRSHGYDVSFRLRHRGWIERYKLLADRVTIATCSNYSRDLLIAAGIPAQRIVTVANGVDPTAFDASSRHQRSVGEPFRVLSVGRLVKKKDPRPTIEAIGRLRDLGIDASLTIAGDGELRGTVEEFIENHNLSAHVKLMGAVSHSAVIRLLQNADAFVQHSVTAAGGDEEGMPMSVLEAMASGLAVVGTHHAGIPEAIGDAGHLIEPGDTDSLFGSLQVIAEDPAEAYRLGDRARVRIQEHHTWELERAGLRTLLEID